MHLLYISYGNIPSQWAHTIQQMKMAEALSLQVDNFRLLTQKHWSYFFLPRFKYERWYGLQHSFPVVEIPMRHLPKKRIHEQVFDKHFSKQALDYCIKHKPDVVYTRHPYLLSDLIKNNFQVIFESHGHAQGKTDKLEALKKHATDQNLCTLVATNEIMKEHHIRLGVPRERIVVFPNAINLSAFTVTEDKKTLRQRFGIPEKAFVAVYCGHLYRDRGIEDILQATQQLPNIFFVLAGGRKEDLLHYKKQAEKTKNILFKGHLPHAKIPLLLSAADVLLMPYPSLCKTAAVMTPLKLFEYMASQRLIIASDLPALKEHLRHNENALLFKTDDALDLIAQIQESSQNPKKNKVLAAQALHDARPYTWDQRATVILNHYNQHSA